MNGLDTLFRKLGQVFNWWVTVAPWERAVRVRLGKHVQVLEPGIHLRVPFTDRIYRQSIRLRTADFEGMQTVTTADGKVVSVSGVIKYRIDDILKLYDEVHHAQDTIIDMVMAEVASYFINRKQSECDPKELQETVREAVDLEQFGLGDVRINITDFAFARAIRLLNEGRRYPSGDGLSTRQVERADGSKQVM